MKAVFWLLLLVEGGAPVHVGNFPDLDTCQQAANGHKVVSRPGIGDPTTFVCVQAKTGLDSDPRPPQ